MKTEQNDISPHQLRQKPVSFYETRNFLHPTHFLLILSIILKQIKQEIVDIIFFQFFLISQQLASVMSEAGGRLGGALPPRFLQTSKSYPNQSGQIMPQKLLLALPPPPLSDFQTFRHP